MARDLAGGQEAKPLRLFVAVDVPASVRVALREAIARFRHRIPGGRWTNPDAWHVTLTFLGATWPRVVDEISAAVMAVAGQTRGFETSLTEIGVFPGPTRARVVWAGLADPEGRFAELSRRLDHALEEHFAPEARPFTPHLTLARLTPPRNIGEFAPDLVGTSVASEPFRTSAVVLYRSHLSPRGATYEPLLTAPFGEGA
jgi:2'-5' RNA ligase